MKKTKVLSVIIAFLIALLLTANVYAEDETGTNTGEGEGTGTEVGADGETNAGDGTGANENWTDFSSAKLEVTQEDETGFKWDYYLHVTNVKLNETSTYQVYIKTGDTDPEFKSTSDSYVGLLNSKGELGATVHLNKVFEKSGNIYCWIVEVKGLKEGTPWKAQITRLQQHKLGSRISCYFSNKETSTSLKEAHSVDSSRKINLKIGTITDLAVLQSIKNGEANCLQKLMNYAKSASSIYTGTVKLGNSNSIMSEMKLSDKAYYYVYMELDSEDGKYYPVEDVSLYQAIYGEKLGWNLVDYLSDSFKWNLENGTPGTADVDTSKAKPTSDGTTSTKKIPFAGYSSVIFAIIVIVTLSTILALKNKKYRDII